MIDFSLSAQIPQESGIYAMYGRRKNDVAYVGLGGDLKRRIQNHMIRRDSSAVTGVSATVLNPDKVSRICWWLHDSFEDPVRLEAAEIVAFRVLNPSLRSQGRNIDRAEAILNSDERFRSEMECLFRSEPNGVYHPPTFDNLMKWAQEIERRVAQLESRLES